jgi:predicted nucleotidyltransferase
MTSTILLDKFRAHALSILSADPRIQAVLEAGAGAENRADRYSDLDLVLIARDADYDALLADREALAARLGRLLSSFTGEHVGEPRLLICLYSVPEGDRVLHVDLKVIRLADLEHRVDFSSIRASY